ncbi:MAG: hypothetical protein LAT58_02640 [Opitutales bacterium]|nr:hypothetical protein [Opitutales bacterium]
MTTNPRKRKPLSPMLRLKRAVGSLLTLTGFLFPGISLSAEPPDPGNATWHIAVSGVMPNDADLDIYPTFKDGSLQQALATSRRYNTSIHFIEKESLVLEEDGFSGEMTFLITPDRWVPSDGQTSLLRLSFEGRFELSDDGENRWVRGSYEGSYDDREVSGNLGGGVGETETEWEQKVMRARVTPVKEEGAPDSEEIQLTVAVDGDQVLWGTVGVSWHRNVPRESFFDVSGLKVEDGKVKGSARLAAIDFFPGADPEATFDVDIGLIRVQGLVGGWIRAPEVPAPIAKAFYGRGTADRGARSHPLESENPPLWRYQPETSGWYRPPPDEFQAVEPGEHPRLLFRAEDVPALREKAETPEGRAIVERLRELLGEDGEAMTERFNEREPHNHFRGPEHPIGTFTMWHGAGFGLLYQLTGEEKYADLAREAVQLAFEGKMDRDNRYSWVAPGTGLRAGTILGGIALAYDLCYHAWPEDFRQEVALRLQNYNQPPASQYDPVNLDEELVELQKDIPAYLRDVEGFSLDYLSGRTGYPPGSNHYGAFLGGFTAVLAIHGDPGTDTAFLDERLREFEHNIPRLLTQGFGDRGFYAEGDHPGRISANVGMLEALIALRNVTGRDYLTATSNAEWVTLKWIHMLIPRGDRLWHPKRGVYGSDHFSGIGQSGSGEFAYGFGSVSPRYHPALLWVYQNFEHPVRPHYGANTYPHRAVHSLVHWPVDVEPANPSGILPHAIVDKVHGYFATRNRWQDENDIHISLALENGPTGYHTLRPRGRGVLIVAGFGTHLGWSTRSFGAQPVAWETEEDGSFRLALRRGEREGALTVDFSGDSGVAGVLLATGELFDQPPSESNSGPIRTHQVEAGGHTVHVITLSEEEHPEVRSGDDAHIQVGSQRFALHEGLLTAR